MVLLRPLILCVSSFIVLPPVSVVQFRGLDCGTLHRTSKEHFLRIDTAVDCDSKAYQHFVVVAALLILLYQCMLAFLALVLYKHRDRLDPVTVSTEPAARAEQRDQDPTIAHLRFLFRDYKCEFFYWEIVDLLRRQILICGVPFLAHVSMRATAGTLISFAGFIVYRELKPYRVPGNALLAMVAQVVLFLVYLAGLLQTTGVMDDTGLGDVEVGGLLVLMVILVAGLAVGLGVRKSMLKKRRQRKWVRPLRHETSARAATPALPCACSCTACACPVLIGPPIPAALQPGTRSLPIFAAPGTRRDPRCVGLHAGQVPVHAARAQDE